MLLARASWNVRRSIAAKMCIRALNLPDRGQIDGQAPASGVADHVHRLGRIVTSAQTPAVEYHECLAVERQVGARQPGKTNAFLRKSAFRSRARSSWLASNSWQGPRGSFYGFGFQQAASSQV
jgi:hypothetical protein